MQIQKEVRSQEAKALAPTARQDMLDEKIKDLFAPKAGPMMEWKEPTRIAFEQSRELGRHILGQIDEGDVNAKVIKGIADFAFAKRGAAKGKAIVDEDIKRWLERDIDIYVDTKTEPTDTMP